MSTRRRNFLKLGLGGIATGAIAPHLWIPRISKAALPIPSSRKNYSIFGHPRGIASPPTLIRY